MAALAVRRRVSRGEVIVEQGEVGVAFYVVVTGKTEISSAQGDCKEVLSVIGPGGFFGEMALFENQVRSATVTALEETELVMLTRWDFLAEVSRPGSGLAIALLTMLARRIRSLDTINHRA
ncbi:MAG TPA: cyclic nucleotide-binding domain-containing protein [Dehalococcoidia bacterium]|nr:cyclic nucleotide-binding domain-containing protein [Dehalococcoidia bacterium]